ncbi:MAG TPA: hypothetical protein VNY30_24105 [Bryobacteraceae bacterium]|nr:hypothetical protein [Bryobacteraceae bacterium]
MADIHGIRPYQRNSDYTLMGMHPAGLSRRWCPLWPFPKSP